jgi:predicted TPR repeat methyltransferase
MLIFRFSSVSLKKMLRSLLNLYQRHAARRMFSRWAPIYEQEVTDNVYSAADEVAVAALAHAGKDALNNPVIVDAGIGTGLAAQQIYDSLPCRIIGLDFTEDMMAQCAAREITELLIKCDVGRDPWPLENSLADLVISAGLFEYLTQDMAKHFIAQAQRVLKPGAALISTYLPSSEEGFHSKIWRGHSGTYLTCAYHPRLMESLLEGFTLLEHTPPFKGSVFHDGSSYDYRLIIAQKN